ncbi:MAG: MAE_28990/MAE_18760 family HEPN-like nuclease [Capnocytophaga sp.]|nr:MAE_28990/MAE_18760 family HEPN-like nuclease [Capnocytophaga sp.]
MDNTLKEYEDKIRDIEIYYNYLKDNEFNMSVEVSKILKANMFLMLYNLIESTVNNSLEAIHNAINNEKLNFEQCIDEIKALWVEYKHQKFEQKKSSEIIKSIYQIKSEIISIDYKKFQEKKLNGISGNLDAKKIRENINPKYSISENKRVEGKKLVEIKNKRNSLAHGEVSFSTLGQRYSIKDLEKYYKECKLFLKEYLSNVEKYIKNKKYRLNSTTNII